MGELSRILSRDAPPTGADAKEYIRILEDEGQGDAEWIKTASDKELLAYMKRLEEQKRGRE